LEFPPPRRRKRIPFGYVLIGITIYCTLAWAILATGVKAGMHALHLGPDVVFARSDRPTGIDAKD
jgi:hypothetical protein